MSERNKLHSVFVYRLQDGVNNSSAVLVAQYDHASGKQSSRGNGVRESEYAKAIATAINDAPPRAGKNTSIGGIGSNGIKVVQSDQYQLVYGVDGDGICYAVVTGRSYPKHIAAQGLVAFSGDFSNQFVSRIPKTADKTLSKAAKKMMLSFCRKYETPANVDKTHEILGTVEVVKGKIQDNIAEALKNTKSAEKLNEKSVVLRKEAEVFRKNAEKVKSKMQWKNRKMMMVVGGIVVFIFVLALLPLFI